MLVLCIIFWHFNIKHKTSTATYSLPPPRKSASPFRLKQISNLSAQRSRSQSRDPTKPTKRLRHYIHCLDGIFFSEEKKQEPMHWLLGVIAVQYNDTHFRAQNSHLIVLILGQNHQFWCTVKNVENGHLKWSNYLPGTFPLSNKVFAMIFWI